MQIDINKDMLRTLMVMGGVVEARDPYTGGHLWRVSQYAKRLATRLGLSSDEVMQMTIGGYMHDLGKVGVPAQILRKADALTDKEAISMFPQDANLHANIDWEWTPN